jgi:flagellar biogenesis protein FliO
MNATPDMLATSLKMLGALALVMAGIGIFFMLSKRFMRKEMGAQGGKMIRVLASQYIGVKKNISLVEIPGAILVVGITGDRIRLLTKIEDKATLDQIHNPEIEHMTPSFSDYLHKITRRLTVSKNDQ